MLIDLVTAKAQELGLTCARLPVHQTDALHHSRWLHIEGRPCQVVSARIFYPQQGRTKLTAYGLYLPTSRWPDFLIYVSKDKTDGSASFFVVPRGDAVKNTSLCGPENWLFKYKDAWSLLSEHLSPAKLKRRFEALNWKLRTLVRIAANKGYEVELVRKVGKPGYIQNRICINGRRCQVMSASRLSSNRNTREWNLININPPTNTWAEFLIFILPSVKESPTIFIAPRKAIHKKTTTSLSAQWINVYLDRWDFLSHV